MISGHGARLPTEEPVWRGCLGEVCWDAPHSLLPPRRAEAAPARPAGCGGSEAGPAIGHGRQGGLSEGAPPHPLPRPRSRPLPGETPGTPGSTGGACALRSCRRPAAPSSQLGEHRALRDPVDGCGADGRTSDSIETWGGWGTSRSACRDALPTPGSCLAGNRGERLCRPAEPAGILQCQLEEACAGVDAPDPASIS
ncbi:uncharacterized protein LOC105865377 isoform X1 [Microcebus murinus]|uniref:uncharacterized protein LOC105865377 isoform X1 n=1 Tax=Microcebus murinus TaxID=30608 RepID=UPI003F6D5A5A